MGSTRSLEGEESVMTDTIPLWFSIAGAITCTYGYIRLEFRASRAEVL